MLTRVRKGGRNGVWQRGVQLPEDILLEIVKLAPSVEDVLRLERVSRVLKFLCATRVVWIAALDTLGFNRPPSPSSRNLLLKLSDSDLRKAIISAAKLDRSWTSRNGPSVTKEISIPFPGRGNRGLYKIVPGANAVINVHFSSIVEYWCLKKRSRLWWYDLRSSARNQFSHAFSIALDCEFDTELSTVTIATCADTDEVGKLVFVLRYDTKLCRLQKLREEYLAENHQRESEVDIVIRGRYLLLQSVMQLGDDDDVIGWGFMVIDWISALAYKIRVAQDLRVTKKCEFAATSNHLFFLQLSTSDNAEKCQLTCVQYTKIAGIPFGQEQVYKLVRLSELYCDQACTTIPVRTPTTKDLGDSRYRIDASQSDWLLKPTSRVTITVCINSSPTSSFHDMHSFVVAQKYIDGREHLVNTKEVYTTKPMVFRLPMLNSWKTIVREIDTLSTVYPNSTRLSSLTYTEENGFRATHLQRYVGYDADPGAQLMAVDAVGRACVCVSGKAMYVRRFDDHQSDD